MHAGRQIPGFQGPTMRTIFVLSGKTTLSEVKDWDVQADFIKKDLREAVKWILANEKDRRGS